MPRKRVNGNIIGARWQDIRLCGEIIAVNRRIGGLERYQDDDSFAQIVNRRIGGLENARHIIPEHDYVNRRIGGLENIAIGVVLYICC